MPVPPRPDAPGRGFSYPETTIPKRTVHKPGEPWDRITQACPKMRTRFDPVVIPELIAWLTMMGRRIENTKSGLLKSGLQHLDPNVARAVEYHDNCLSLIGVLMNSLNDTWSRGEWNDVVVEVDRSIRSVHSQVGEPAEPK